MMVDSEEPYYEEIDGKNLDKSDTDKWKENRAKKTIQTKYLHSNLKQTPYHKHTKVKTFGLRKNGVFGKDIMDTTTARVYQTAIRYAILEKIVRANQSATFTYKIRIEVEK